MISQQEIEALADQIAEPDFELSESNVGELIGHLDELDRHAVLTRAAKIARETGDAMEAAAEDAVRLARATGMPEGGEPVAWLLEHGLIEKVDDRAAPSPTARHNLN